MQLMAFLDRFSFRNPKKKSLVHDESMKRAEAEKDKEKDKAKRGKRDSDDDSDDDNGGKDDGVMDDDEVKAAYDMLAGVDAKYEDAKHGKLRGTGHMQPMKPRRGRVAIDQPADSLAVRQLKPHQVREDDVRGGCGHCGLLSRSRVSLCASGWRL